MSNVYEFPPHGPNADDSTLSDKVVLDELEKITNFMAVARRFGFAVVATPAGQKLLNESQDPRAAAILASVCPIKQDPFSVNASRNATTPKIELVRTFINQIRPLLARNWPIALIKIGFTVMLSAMAVGCIALICSSDMASFWLVSLCSVFGFLGSLCGIIGLFGLVWFAP